MPDADVLLTVLLYAYLYSFFLWYLLCRLMLINCYFAFAFCTVIASALCDR